MVDTCTWAASCQLPLHFHLVCLSSQITGTGFISIQGFILSVLPHLAAYALAWCPTLFLWFGCWIVSATLLLTFDTIKEAIHWDTLTDAIESCTSVRNGTANASHLTIQCVAGFNSGLSSLTVVCTTWLHALYMNHWSVLSVLYSLFIQLLLLLVVDKAVHMPGPP